jgi:hypothetical protein
MSDEKRDANTAPRNTDEQLVKLALRVADCLHTAVLCGRGLGTAFCAEAKNAESKLREFINEPNAEG